MDTKTLSRESGVSVGEELGSQAHRWTELVGRDLFEMTSREARMGLYGL